MGLVYHDLDERTRHFMVQELKHDERQGTVYFSPLLTEKGRGEYPELLLQAFLHGNDEWLASALRARGRMTIEVSNQEFSELEPADRDEGEPEALALAEFNRYYARGVCRRALDEGRPSVHVYTSGDPPATVLTFQTHDLLGAPSPRDRSEAVRSIDPRLLLEQLRAATPESMTIGIPAASEPDFSIEL